jgi:hypothetical protein
MEKIKTASPIQPTEGGLGEYLREHVRELKAELVAEKTEKLRALSLMTPEQLTLLRSPASDPSDGVAHGLTSKSETPASEPSGDAPVSLPRKRSWL